MDLDRLKGEGKKGKMKRAAGVWRVPTRDGEPTLLGLNRRPLLPLAHFFL